MIKIAQSFDIELSRIRLMQKIAAVNIGGFATNTAVNSVFDVGRIKKWLNMGKTQYKPTSLSGSGLSGIKGVWGRIKP